MIIYTKDDDNFKFVQDSLNVIDLFNKVSLKLTQTRNTLHPNWKRARGNHFRCKTRELKKLKYAIKIEGNQLILDNYLLTD
jgi:hypothetical protein